jgi:hypothetical protein
MVYYYQKPLIFSFFIVTCVLGMVAAVSPRRCSRLSSFKKYQSIETEEIPGKEIAKNKFMGHHPDCDVYRNHIYNINGKKYCAGCSGLFIGALIAVVGSVLYYFYGISDGSNGNIIFLIGFISVLVSLLQNFLLKLNLNVVKFFFNMMLVVGSFIMLIGMNELNSSLFIQLYFLVLVLIWILARITSSENNHAKICGECGMTSWCAYR